MKIHASAKVHPTCVLEGDDIEIGAGSTVGPLSYLKGPIVIGENTHLWPHCIIGTDGEHKTLSSKGIIRIGSRTILRELCVLQRGTGDRDTTIGDDCYIMDHAHLGHDVVIGNNVTSSPNVSYGGHARVHDGATIGMSSSMHQFSTIGAYAMIGMGAIVTRDVPPFALVVGSPAVFQRLNTHPMKRLGIPEDQIVIEGGLMTSTHPIVAAALEKFMSDHRDSRKLMVLTKSDKS